MAVTVDKGVLDELGNPKAKALMDTIDDLRILGVGDTISLPQIVVAGDQSSGKSSVLEAISRVKFPVEADICTRFATELILRPATQHRVNVKVIFSNTARASHDFGRTNFHQNDLPAIIEEAKKIMGVTAGLGPSFSKDILQLRIEGPQMYPLTLVDLPGFFHSGTADQSTAEREIVNELADRYMRLPSTIILAVVAANSPRDNQIVLDKAKLHDPEQKRTLGIVTKPDLTHPGSSEQQTFIRVVRGQEPTMRLSLGWHVLVEGGNFGTRDRDEERFFDSSAWKSIFHGRRGISNLRQRLSSVLFDHIQQNLPTVITDIENSLKERQGDMDRLGKPRSTLADQRSYLLRIAEDFSRLALVAVEGRYNDPFFGDLNDGDRKLRALLRNFDRALVHTLATRGAAQVIMNDGADGNDEKAEINIPPHLKSFLESHPYPFDKPQRIESWLVNEELAKAAALSQGSEFPGLPNNDLALHLFRRQCKPWRAIAEFHIGQVTAAIKFFVDQLLIHLAGPPELNFATEAILRSCVDPFFEAKSGSLRQRLEEILRPYEDGYGLPVATEFLEAYCEKSLDRLTSRLADALDDHQNQNDKPSTRLPRSKILEAIDDSEVVSGANEFGTEKVIVMMEVYYDMSLRTFTDNNINLAIESCLVRAVPRILTPGVVDAMSKEWISEIAAESPDVTAKRHHLQQDVDVLEKGLRLCRFYKPRHIVPQLHPRPPLTAELGEESASQQREKDASSKQLTVLTLPSSAHPIKASLPNITKGLFASVAPVLKPSSTPAAQSTQRLPFPATPVTNTSVANHVTNKGKYLPAPTPIAPLFDQTPKHRPDGNPETPKSNNPPPGQNDSGNVFAGLNTLQRKPEMSHSGGQVTEPGNLSGLFAAFGGTCKNPDSYGFGNQPKPDGGSPRGLIGHLPAKLPPSCLWPEERAYYMQKSGDHHLTNGWDRFIHVCSMEENRNMSIEELRLQHMEQEKPRELVKPPESVKPRREDIQADRG